jgi:ATP-dependent Zn protease
VNEPKEKLIPYDRMKEQIIKELTSVFENSTLLNTISLPEINYEKGSTQISFTTPPLTDSMLFNFLAVIKKHIEHMRIASFEEGHYSFQALNTNIFKSDNILDNIKFEFFSLINSKAVISRKGNMTQEEINTVIELFKSVYSSAGENPVLKLNKLGASLISDNASMNWDYIAGYEEVKRNIRESILLPLKNRDLYDSIAKMTRRVFESNRPRAILFEGAPGVGKTTVARIIADEIDIPLVYVPIESIMSKWFGQSAQNLSQIFDLCEELGGSIIFIDEIDSLAGSRDQNMFEATRRILSVLLRKLDGIDAALNTITIGATNRKNDLDNALISRFDQIIRFPLPNRDERASIFRNYARHLAEEDCKLLGERSEGLSGRNIKDTCEFTERRWARTILVKKIDPAPPPADYYKRCITMWKNND